MTPERPIPLAVLRARAGDRAACRELYDAHVDAVHGFCVAFCRGDREQAADLAQESFARAFASLPELQDPAAFSGWLMTITRRVCLAWIAGRQREQAALGRLAEEPAPARPTSEAALKAVSEVIDACPDEHLRAVALLFYREPPHSTAEIAARLGLTQTAVTTRLLRFREWAKRRMLARLAAALEDEP